MAGQLIRQGAHTLKLKLQEPKLVWIDQLRAEMMAYPDILMIASSLVYMVRLILELLTRFPEHS